MVTTTDQIGLIFDMDGVIVDNHEYHYLAWQKLSAKYDKPIGEADYREQMNGRTLREVVTFVFGKGLSEERIHKIAAEKEALYRKLYQPFLTPTPGLLQFLNQAGQAMLPMVIGTSAPAINVHYTMKGTGIRHYFRSILDDTSVTKGKPDPEIYIKCARILGLPNENCIVFEDAVAGVQAAKAASSKVVGLATSHPGEHLNADLVIDNFNQIDLEQIRSILSK